jgi:asparagine synthetase B (glutamine-hydrolysing)
MDISRLPSRNLSRDDRIISSNARDARYPYLSLSFISRLSELPVEIKCDPRLPEGDGDKVLLRRAALSVGLSGAASRKKRAMQFGTRSAKMTADQGKGRGGGDRKVE